MNKWIGAGVLVAAAGAGLAWQQGWFGAAPAGSTQLTDFVPADTVLYLGGQAEAKQVEQLRQMPLMAQSQFQMQQLLREMDNWGREETPQARFATELLRDFLSNATNYGMFMDHFGLDLTKPQAIYMDGLIPVVRFGVKNEETFWQVFERASESSGLQPREVTLDGSTVKLWRLTKEDDKALELAVNVRDGVATLSAFHFLDQEADQLQRLAMTAPEQSLADSGELDKMQKTYGFDNSMLALIHFERLAQGMLDSNSNDLGRDLKALMDAQGETLPTANLDAACRSDLTSLVANVPRLVAGNTRVASGDTLAIDSLSVLELTNKEVLTSLQGLRGHLPGHTAGSDSIFNMGFGINVDNLIPTATSLMQRFQGYQTDCAQLQQAQQQLSSANPAMMGMFTGMVQGTKGAGFSLYDLDIDPNTLQPNNLDFLFSVATDNPNSLLGLLAMSPMGRQIQIPTDGSLTDVDLSFVAPGLSLKAGMQGQHLVAFTGEQASRAAESLKDESLDANGLTRFGADYGRLADLVDRIPSQFAGELETGTASGCVAQAQVANMLRLQGANLNYTLDFAEQGLSTNMAFSIDPQALASVNPVGNYQILDQSYDCQGGEPMGTEEIREDGTGEYRYNDGQCDLYRSQYTWSQNGNLFSMTAQESVSRDSCDQEWNNDELITSQCVLVPMDEGFRCLYSDDESESLFHYVPRS